MGVSMRKTGRSGISDINITPMIDVLLVLLVIFIIMQEFLLKTVDIQLPQEARQAPASPPSVIVLEIEPGGVYRVNRRPMSKAELGTFLTRTYTGRPDKVIFVKASGQVRYRDVIGAIDLARGAGVKAIGAVLQQF